MKILATDMDGTFLDAEGTFDTLRLKSFLDSCDKEGYLFTVASGRALLALETMFSDYLNRIALIAENGGLVQYKGEVLFEAKVEPNDYLKVVDTVKSLDGCQGVLLSGRQAGYTPLDVAQDYREQMAEYYENIIAMPLEDVKDDIFKVTATFPADVVLEREQWLNSHLVKMTAVTTGFESIDIIPEGVHKGVGLDHLCQALGKSSDDVIAFGDNLNDMEMLAFAGTAVAVSNARDEVKEVADTIIGHHAEGAVFDYMEEVVTRYV